jgi:hypothetical protein
MKTRKNSGQKQKAVLTRKKTTKNKRIKKNFICEDMRDLCA